MKHLKLAGIIVCLLVLFCGYVLVATWAIETTANAAVGLLLVAAFIALSVTAIHGIAEYMQDNDLV